MLQKIWLVSLAVVLTSGCKTIEPHGGFCTTRAADQIDICFDIKTQVRLPDVPLSQTDKFIHFSPETWQSIQDYIDYLKSRAGGSGKVNINSIDLENLQNIMLNLREKSLDANPIN